MYKEVNKVILTDENIQKLVEWKDNNKDLVRNRKDVFKKGVIEFGSSSIYFERQLFSMNFKYFIHKQRYLEFDYSLITKQAKITYQNPLMNKATGNNQYGLIQDVIMIHSTTMAYMEHYEPVVKEKQIQQNVNTKSKNKKNKSKSSNKIVYLKEVVYKYTSIDTNKLSNKGKHGSPTISFSVKGHWRQYKKTGKRVWIEEYIKGDKKDIQGKQYRLK